MPQQPNAVPTSSSTGSIVHRSYVVNLDRIAEIAPTDGGDARLRMKDGSQVPCNRRYRDALAGPA